jgi:uncharacterized protein YcfL
MKNIGQYKKWVYLILTAFLTVSCVDHNTSSKYYIRNNSNQKIILIIQDTIRLEAGDFNMEKFNARWGVPMPPLFSGDSVIITYNDTVSITHYRVEEQGLLQNIWDEKSWKGGRVDDYEYLYEYIITDADYEEALNW